MRRCLLVLLTCLLAACGQRGPLYLPEEPAEEAVPGAGAESVPESAPPAGAPAGIEVAEDPAAEDDETEDDAPEP